MVEKDALPARIATVAARIKEIRVMALHNGNRCLSLHLKTSHRPTVRYIHAFEVMTEAIHRLYEASMYSNYHHLGLVDEPDRPITTFAILSALGLINPESDKAVSIQELLATTDRARDGHLAVDNEQYQPLLWNQPLNFPSNIPGYACEQPELFATPASSGTRGQLMETEFCQPHEHQPFDVNTDIHAFPQPSGDRDVFFSECFWQIPANEWNGQMKSKVSSRVRLTTIAVSIVPHSLVRV
ncbi:LOW QUALITY PROTEIN: uncharacterized protein Z519_12723 [Cladophialophora bantiana CBS 173.52]|uniref:Uncharacterized protein n=1 Tax=Cladophialophora bantiana (strain ATCC 10958 / CBS 173.52 / CDC B-1940 / NIH 8579) TaxID=1442370 RepID=A0A0D2H059_CLAB1|nr:LOW QUALITY PROTEIN: uncharacterized protein Z519_12723 [Cladophialophora bantiana CBS 173.52]KIW86668.1 LOW QUALITY PROTEIN: hypothetical protein Z519_12723 [Cladophialophora bantiana CBS 173.52]